MKKKKLKKLIHTEFEKYQGNRDVCEKVSTPIFSQSHICEHDEEISNRIFNFILNLIKLQSKLNLDFNENYINIHCDLSQFRKSSSTSKSINTSKEEYIEISINREGFRVRRNYDNFISFKDENFLEKLKPHLVERYRKTSKENIKEIMDDVMCLTNLSRENNLDELLNS